MAEPEYLKPFVLPVKELTPERDGPVDLYVPASAAPVPAVVFVHGGPLPAQVSPRPREWPMYRGYASLVASRGLAGVVVDHRLYDPGAYTAAADDVAAAVERARQDPRMDADRVALWFFSGGGLLSADWLGTPPPYLRVLAATYPVLAPIPGLPTEPRFQPIEALPGAGTLSIVLTRVGQEHPGIAATQAAFVEAARDARLEVIDVPDGHHGFDYLDDTDQSRAAIERAVDLVHAALTA